MEKFSNKLKNLSVFFPACNEENNIVKTVEHAFKTVPKLAEQFEIIVVDDGSGDRTGERLADLSAKYSNLRVITHPRNRGYGAAIRSGFLNAKYEYIFFTDSDGQFNIEELEKFLPLIRDYDIIAGFRIKRSDSLHRLINAKAYNLLIKLIFGLHLKDIDCAFKLIRKKVIDSLLLKSEGAFVSAELLIKSKKKGFTIKQIGVSHFPRKKGKSSGNRPSVVAKSFAELFKLWKELK
jgi:glycosyltransferase involved in cell wall biosynthesis